MTQDVGGNEQLFWKEVGKLNGGKGESCSKIKDGKERVAVAEDKL